MGINIPLLLMIMVISNFVDNLKNIETSKFINHL